MVPPLPLARKRDRCGVPKPPKNERGIAESGARRGGRQGGSGSCRTWHCHRLLKPAQPSTGVHSFHSSPRTGASTTRASSTAASSA